MGIKYFFLIFISLCSLSLTAQNETLGMASAVEMALRNNYDLVITEKEKEIAEINNSWGMAGRYPVIEFDAVNSNSMDADNNKSFRITTGLGLNWLLFDGFRVRIIKDQMEIREELSEETLALNVENTVEDIILAYNNVLLQEETLKVFRDLMDLSFDRYDYEMKKHELGSSVSYEVLQAKNIYLSDKALYMRQEVEVRNALRTLNFIMGEDPGELWTMSGELEPDTSDYKLSDLRQKMLSNNHVLRNQYLNIRLREKDKEIRKSDFYPEIRFSTGIQNVYNRNVLSGEDPVSSNDIGPYANINLSYILYNGGIRKKALEISRINEEISGVEAEQIEHSLLNELLAIYDNYKLRLELLKIAEEGIETAKLNLQIAEEKFKTGAINSFNYRDIQLIYLNAALEKLNASFSLIASHAALTRITGGFISKVNSE